MDIQMHVMTGYEAAEKIRVYNMHNKDCAQFHEK